MPSKTLPPGLLMLRSMCRMSSPRALRSCANFLLVIPSPENQSRPISSWIMMSASPSALAIIVQNLLRVFIVTVLHHLLLLCLCRGLLLRHHQPSCLTHVMLFDLLRVFRFPVRAVVSNAFLGQSRESDLQSFLRGRRLLQWIDCSGSIALPLRLRIGMADQRIIKKARGADAPERYPLS